MESELPVVEDIRQLFLANTPLMDVRAPIEFTQGSFPAAVNYPLIDNEERHEIGKKYKDAGQDAAIELGIELVAGEKKQQRINHWKQFTEQYPQGVLYCFRGGLRSKTSQQWLYENTGIRYPRVVGGYKKMRRFLIDELTVSAAEINPVVIGGRTGVGKTVFLKTLDHMLDLEGLAWHRGSAFGHHATPQPTQIDFENALSIKLLQHRHQGNQLLPTEDEGNHVGSVHIPIPLYDKLHAAPLVLLEASVEARVSITLDEYIHQALAEYQQLYGTEQGFEQWADYLLTSVDKIKRRLGGERHRDLYAQLKEAIRQHRETGETEQHRDWIETLLVKYYDPMYDYQIDKKKQRIQFKGNEQEIRAYLLSLKT